MSSEQNLHEGRVIFAGAGPGDPDLITVAAAKALALAEVIVCDRLVSPAILELYAGSTTHIIHVGKQSGNRQSSRQDDICNLLVMQAKLGLRVVRLKGGDVSIFSNILDELLALKTAGIAYDIIPGITAASGAAAWTGIPLTARGYSRAVRYLSLHEDRQNTTLEAGDRLNDSCIDWAELGKTKDTLVFYMSASRAVFLASHLLAAGMCPGMPLAVIEQASTPAQKVNLFTIGSLSARLADLVFKSPSLIIVGRVVELYDLFGYKHQLDISESPLHFPEPKQALDLLPITLNLLKHAG